MTACLPDTDTRLTDERANVALVAATELAVSLRDDGPAGVSRAAERLLTACGGDPVAAVCVTAALIRTELPVDAWWQRGLDGLHRKVPSETSVEPAKADSLADVRQPCGTHAAFNRHKAHGEQPCEACIEAERAYQQRRRAAA